MLALLLITCVLVISIHYLLIGPYGYWKKRGVPNPKPVPIFGNIAGTILLTKMVGEIFQDIYNEFQDYKYVGIYKARTPAVLLRDPELIKEVLVKNFASFHDNDVNVDENLDPIVARNPFFIRGDRWKIVRAQVTSNITTGKIKNMFCLISNVGRNMVEYLMKISGIKESEGIEVKELSIKFTIDAVALCAFGLEGRSFIEPDSEFRRMGRKFLSPSIWMGIKHTVMFVMPLLARIFKIRFIPTEVDKWFKTLLMETIKYRKDNNIVRNDYLDMMIALKDKPGEYVFTDIDVIAQAMTFYIDGFETSSIALSFTLYEIAANPNVQNTLKEEIDAILLKYNGEITYDALQEMSYLEKVLWEGLRMYPPGTVLTKQCTKSFTFPPPTTDGSGNSVDIPEGMNILIPVLALHYDPKYFPDPYKFDPERHSDKVKDFRPKNVFLPFGDGPRQCLGYRFALAQNKAAIVAIVQNFEIKVNPKTIVPIKLDASYFMPAAKGGLWLNFYKRN